MPHRNFTFVITTFRSQAVIDECLKDMPKDIKKIMKCFQIHLFSEKKFRF